MLCTVYVSEQYQRQCIPALRFPFFDISCFCALHFTLHFALHPTSTTSHILICSTSDDVKFVYFLLAGHIPSWWRFVKKNNKVTLKKMFKKRNIIEAGLGRIEVPFTGDRVSTVMREVDEIRR